MAIFRLLTATTFGAGIALTLPILAAEPRVQSRAGTVGGLAQLSTSLQELSERVSPSVVQITGTGYGLAGHKQQNGIGIVTRERSIGSGVIVTEDGYIVTNAHVIEGARTIRIKVNGNPAIRNLGEAKGLGLPFRRMLSTTRTLHSAAMAASTAARSAFSPERSQLRLRWR